MFPSIASTSGGHASINVSTSGMFFLYCTYEAVEWLGRRKDAAHVLCDRVFDGTDKPCDTRQPL